LLGAQGPLGIFVKIFTKKVESQEENEQKGVFGDALDAPGKGGFSEIDS
jgi:hypothetical protein